jgi:hypothetical protein
MAHPGDPRPWVPHLPPTPWAAAYCFLPSITALKFIARLNQVGNEYVAPRSYEFGYANYELEEVRP